MKERAARRVGRREGGKEGRRVGGREGGRDEEKVLPLALYPYQIITQLSPANRRRNVQCGAVSDSIFKSKRRRDVLFFQTEREREGGREEGWD